jgi:integrase
MAVYWQPDHQPPRWLVDFIWTDAKTGKQRRIRRTAKDDKGRLAKSKTAAEAHELRIRTALAEGTFEVDPTASEPTPGVPTMMDYQATYLEDVATRLKPQTLHGKKRELASLLSLQTKDGSALLGPLTLDAIDATVFLEATKALLARGLSAKTVNNQLSSLHSLLAHAAEQKVIGAVPKVRWQKTTTPGFKFFDHAETAKLVEHAPPLVVIGVKTGMRIGELLELKWGDVSLARKQLTVARSVWWEPKGGPKHVTAPKNHKPRTIPLSGEALAALESLPAERPPRSYVFVDEAGNQLTPGACKWPLWRAEDAAELPRTGPHVLRHTFASLLVMNGVALPAVQALMGHSTIQMTMKYAHLAPGHLRAAIETLS